MISPDVLSNLTNTLKSQKDILFAYLFGSQASGKASPISDTDIAIFLADGKSKRFQRKLELISKISQSLGTEAFDLVILNEAPVSLSYPVIKTGKLLFSKRETLRIRFITKTLSIFFDQAYLRNIQWKYLSKRIAHG